MQFTAAKRTEKITPFLAMEIMERAKTMEQQGREIIYLCLGEPDFPTPEPICDSAIDAIRQGATTYTHSLGLIELRKEIVNKHRQQYGVEISPEQILVSSGTSPLMLMLFSALLNDGDEILLTDPCYACYPSFINFAGGIPVSIPTLAVDGFQPDPKVVKGMLNERTKGILLNSPSNPAGSIIDEDRFQGLADLGIPLISDEIYHGLTYEGEERCALEFTDNAFVLGGFSKSYAMTGWRLGYLIVPPSWVRVMQTLHQNFFISANNFVQIAGITALKEGEPYLDEMREIYNKRRLHMAKRLKEIGFGIERLPVGAFYILANAKHLSNDSVALANEILDATGVAVTPGIDFGNNAEGYIRFSYANSLENIDKALDLIDDFVKNR